jgi:hypothetical protein
VNIGCAPTALFHGGWIQKAEFGGKIMELSIVLHLIEQLAAIALFVGLLYVLQLCMRSSRYLEDRNQLRINAAHQIRSGAFRQSVEYLRSIDVVPTGGRIKTKFQEPEDVEKRLPVETEWKHYPDMSNTQGQHRSGGSGRIAG